MSVLPEELSVFFSLNPQAMWVLDPRNMRFLEVNEAAQRLYGYSRREFLRMSLAEIMARPAFDPRTLKHVRKSASEGRPAAGRARHRRKDGTVVEIEFFVLPIELRGAKALLATMVDRSRPTFEPYSLPVLFRTSQQAMWVYDTKTLRFLAANDAALRLYGYKREELMRMTLRDIRPPKDIPRMLATAKKALRKASHHAGIFTHLKKDGTPLEIDVFTHSLTFAGRAARLALLNDVTESRRLERKLLETTAQLEALFNSSRDGISLNGGDGSFIRVNKAYERLSGRSGRELLKMNLRQLTPLKHLSRLEKAFRALNRGASSVTLEREYLHKDGSVLPVEIIAFPVKDGERFLSYAAIARDISERKEAERKLAEANAWFEALFSSSGDAIDTVTRYGRLVDFNPALERLLGYPREELLGMRFQQFTPPEYRAADEQAFGKLAQGAASVEFEKELIRKDGVRVPVRLTCFSVKDKAGVVLGYAAIIKDITERRRLERQISETSAREQSRIGRDLHDSVGQTLTALSLLSRSLRSELTGPSAEKARRLEELSRAAIQQVRGVARGLLPAELETGDLGAALSSLTEGARQLFEIRCSARVRGNGQLKDKAAAVDLYRIAQEAVVNAAKHAGARSVAVSLEVGLRRLRLVIRDDGAGFKESHGESRGLGLAIMRHRAESLGGLLEVRPGRFRGTEVVCEAPVQRQAPAPSRARQ